MSRTALPIVSMIGILLLLVSPCLAGPADDARKSYELGNELLASADFSGALRAFATAAKGDPSQKQYLESFALVRQIMLMQRSLESGLAPAEWEATARGLHRFYSEYGIHQAALPLDRKIHEKLDNADSATLLASTLLALDQPGEAEHVLASIDRTKATPQSDALFGIALAHQKKLDDAAAVAARIRIPEGADPGLLFDLGRLHCLLDHPADSYALLTRSFESTVPPELEKAKVRARACPDFSTIVASPEFRTVLLVKSKVAMSSCSGGSSCGSCSMSGSCGMEKGESCDMEKQPGTSKQPDGSTPK